MSRATILMTLVAAAIVALPAHDAAASSLKSRSALTRAAGAPDPDARGEVRIESEPDRDRHSIEVKARYIDPSIEHALYLADAVGALQFIANLVPDGADEVRYRARTDDGDPLPFGAATPDELQGRALEIRQLIGGQEHLLLVGHMPGTQVGRGGSARGELDPTALAAPRSRVRLKLRSRPSSGDERFELKANRLDFSGGQDYRLFLEDPGDPGILVDVGALERRRTSSSARLRRRTKDGESLPFGVSSVADLADLALEIVDVSSGDVHFEGLVPGLD